MDYSYRIFYARCLPRNALKKETPFAPCTEHGLLASKASPWYVDTYLLFGARQTCTTLRVRRFTKIGS
jgi:hypothetical protein